MKLNERFYQLKYQSKSEKISVILLEMIDLAEEINNLEVKKWASLELNGYLESNPSYIITDTLPEYRTVIGEFYDYYDRPLIINEDKLKFFNTIKLAQGVVELEFAAVENKILTVKSTAAFEILRGFDIIVNEFRFHSSAINSVLFKIRTVFSDKLNQLKSDLKINDVIEFDNMDMQNLHPEIIKVSQKLYLDGYYRQAVLDCFIHIIDYVKIKSGRHDIDGVPLMQTVLSPKNPLINLTNNPDQQLGFMWLYSGAVMGIRNYYAHRIVEIKDKQEAYELLCFASLLLRFLDKTK
ncbi:MAG: TIGR02391 family protein [Mariniphaga sp.]